MIEAFALLLQCGFIVLCGFIGYLIGREAQPLQAWIVSGCAALAITLGAAVTLGIGSSSPVPESLGGEERETGWIPTREQRFDHAVFILVCVSVPMVGAAHFASQRWQRKRAEENRKWQQERALIGEREARLAAK